MPDESGRKLVFHHLQWYVYPDIEPNRLLRWASILSWEEIKQKQRRRTMKKGIILATLALAATMMASVAAAAPAGGEATFKAKCASCHPDGGNIMKPGETLKGMKDSKKIVSKIRKGGGGMTAFDAKAISDADAKAVADYIIKTFKK
jgi:cytochrome c6